MPVTLYHNPRCSKSRATLALLQEKGVSPEIVEYLNAPPSVDELKRILTMLGMKPRELLRFKEAKEAGLDDSNLSDDALIAGMVANPIVIERPIVVSGGKARIGRPPESVLEIVEVVG
jgi:arsenate reductase